MPRREWAHRGTKRLLNIYDPWQLPVTDNLLAWYDASALSSITDAGSGAVSAWADKSGNGYTLSQGTSANRPTTGTRTLNGLNVIDFDGSNDLMTSSCPADDRTSTTFVVGLSDDTTSQYCALYGSNGNGGDLLRTNQTSGVWQMEAQGLIATLTAGFGPVASTAFVTQAIYWAAGVSLFQSDSIILEGRSSDSTAFTSGRTLVLGASNTSFPWNGYIAEFVRYSATLRVSDASKVVAYLRAKWGIA